MERLERQRKRQNKFQLRASVLKAARALASIKKNLKLNKILVDWIEQQNPVISARYGTSIHDDTEGNNNQRLTKNARSQKPSESSLLPHNGPSHEPEASKRLATKRTLSRQKDSSIIISRRKRNQIPIMDVCKRRSKRLASLKEKRQARDKEILPLYRPPPPSDRAGSSSFKVTTTKKRPNKSTNRQVRNKRKDGANSEPPAKVQLHRRSTRVSKKPERFGFA